MKYHIALSIILLTASSIIVSKNLRPMIAWLLPEYIENVSVKFTPAQTSSIKNIVFDLDGVLCCTNKMQAFYEIGILDTLQLIYELGTLPSEKLLFDALADVPALSTEISFNKGLRMPQIMIDWQTSKQSLSAIMQTVSDHLAIKNMSEIAKKWVNQSIKMMTNPEAFIRTRQLITPMIRCAQELKAKGYKLYILSNWDAPSFIFFQQKFSDFFTYNNQFLFDGIMISGNVGMIKPNVNIFQACIKKYKLDPRHTLFIDDEPANILTAQAENFITILADPKDTKKTIEAIGQLV